MIYGLGVLDMLGFLYEIDTVELTIVQPRIEHFSTWKISAEELLAWGKDVLEPGAAKALAGEGEFKAGDHCRFCKARFTCRARAEEYLKLAQMEFAEPALMSDEEITEVLSKADALKNGQKRFTPMHRMKRWSTIRNGRDTSSFWEEATVNIRMKRMWQRQHRKLGTRISLKRA